jgi:hypothetical protein
MDDNLELQEGKMPMDGGRRRRNRSQKNSRGMKREQWVEGESIMVVLVIF